MQKLLTFFSKNISIYAIFNDQSFNNTLTNNIVSFEQLGPVIYMPYLELHETLAGIFFSSSFQPANAMITKTVIYKH